MATLRTIGDVIDAEPVKVCVYPPKDIPNYKELCDKYKEEYKQSGSFDVTVPYGVNYGRTHCVTDVTQPYCQNVSQFAVEEHNKDLVEDKLLSLANVVRVNYEYVGLGILLYLTFNVKDLSGNENMCRAKVFTCICDCKVLREFALAPFRSRVYHIGWMYSITDKQELVDAIKVPSKEELEQMSYEEKSQYLKLLKQQKMAKAQERIKIENAEQEEAGYVKVYEVGEPCTHMKDPYNAILPGYTNLVNYSSMDSVSQADLAND